MSEKNTRNQWCKLETSALSHIFVRTAEEDNRTTAEDNKLFSIISQFSEIQIFVDIFGFSMKKICQRKQFEKRTRKDLAKFVNDR